MKIYACERYHDNDCGMFSSLEAALAHLDGCRCCEVQEYELRDEQFAQTDLTISHLSCENCGTKGRSDTTSFTYREGHHFCSRNCDEETAEFYAAGYRGIYGSTTQQVKQRLQNAALDGSNPYEGCYGRNLGEPAVIRWETTETQ